MALIKANVVTASSNPNPVLNPGGSWTQPPKDPPSQPAESDPAPVRVENCSDVFYNLPFKA